MREYIRKVNLLLIHISIVVTVISIIVTVVGIIVTLKAIRYNANDINNKRSNRHTSR